MLSMATALDGNIFAFMQIFAAGSTHGLDSSWYDTCGENDVWGVNTVGFTNITGCAANDKGRDCYGVSCCYCCCFWSGTLSVWSRVQSCEDGEWVNILCGAMLFCMIMWVDEGFTCDNYVGGMFCTVITVALPCTEFVLLVLLAQTITLLLGLL